MLRIALPVFYHQVSFGIKMEYDRFSTEATEANEIIQTLQWESALGRYKDEVGINFDTCR